MGTADSVAADTLATPEGEFAAGSFARAALVAVPLFLFAGGVAARLSGSTDANPWYQSLVLPVFQPPPALFGIAWAILYVLLGLSYALVWGTRHVGPRRLALGLFTLGLMVNLTWSPLFFRLHMISAALGVVVVMLLLAIATIWAFFKVNRLAGWLMLPYGLWLCFATLLNASIMMLNPMADAMQIGV